jgi:hypothetical protein
MKMPNIPFIPSNVSQYHSSKVIITAHRWIASHSQSEFCGSFVKNRENEVLNRWSKLRNNQKISLPTTCTSPETGLGPPSPCWGWCPTTLKGGGQGGERGKQNL